MKNRGMEIKKLVCFVISFIGLLLFIGKMGNVELSSDLNYVDVFVGVIGMMMFGLFAWLGGAFCEE